MRPAARKAGVLGAAVGVAAAGLAAGFAAGLAAGLASGFGVALGLSSSVACASGAADTITTLGMVATSSRMSRLPATATGRRPDGRRGGWVEGVGTSGLRRSPKDVGTRGPRRSPTSAAPSASRPVDVDAPGRRLDQHPHSNDCGSGRWSAVMPPIRSAPATWGTAPGGAPGGPPAPTHVPPLRTIRRIRTIRSEGVFRRGTVGGSTARSRSSACDRARSASAARPTTLTSQRRAAWSGSVMRVRSTDAPAARPRGDRVSAALAARRRPRPVR